MNEKNIHKTNWLKSIIKHGKWYILASLLTKGIGILLMPVYTRYLSTSDYGILTTLNSITQLLPIFMSLYLDAAFGRFFHDYKNDESKLAALFSSLYWFVILFGGAILGLSIFSSHFWLESFFTVKAWPYAYLAFVPALLAQIALMGEVFLRQSLESKKTSFLLIGSTVVNIIVTLPLLIYFEMGVIARLWGGLLSSLFLFSYYTFYFRQKKLLIFQVDKKLLKMCLLYSIPLIPNVAGGWIAGMSDRLIIAKYDGLGSVGLYGIGFQLAFILYVIQDAITQVQGPINISGLIDDKENTKKKMAKMSLMLLVLMLIAHLGLYLFSKEIITIFAEKSYIDAFVVVGILSFTYVLSSQYRLFADVISYHKKTWVISSAGILMGILNLGLNIVFVPKFGYLAAAFATVLSTLLYTVWIIYWAQRFDKIPVRWMKVAIILGCYGTAIYIGYNISIRSIGLVNFSLKLCLLIATFILIKGVLGQEFSFKKMKGM